MAAFPRCIPAAPPARATPASEGSWSGLDGMLREQMLASERLQLSMQEQMFETSRCSPPSEQMLASERLRLGLLQHQLAQSQALLQTGLPCLRPPPGLVPVPPCLAPKATPSEDDGSTVCSSQTRTCDDSRSDSGVSQPENLQTTLMIRNIPVLYTRDMLAAEWLNEDTYDFLYLPYCCTSQRNLSYGFLNFTSEAAALVFVQRWQKQRLAHFSSRKPLNISFADVQGLEPNLLELKKKRVSRVKAEQCQPLIFWNGRSVSLSEALRALENEKQQVGQSFSF